MSRLSDICSMNCPVYNPYRIQVIDRQDRLKACILEERARFRSKGLQFTVVILPGATLVGFVYDASSFSDLFLGQ